MRAFDRVLESTGYTGEKIAIILIWSSNTATRQNLYMTELVSKCMCPIINVWRVAWSNGLRCTHWKLQYQLAETETQQAGHGGSCQESQHLRARSSGIRGLGYPLIHSKFEASLGYIRHWLFFVFCFFMPSRVGLAPVIYASLESWWPARWGRLSLM